MRTGDHRRCNTPMKLGFFGLVTLVVACGTAGEEPNNSQPTPTEPPVSIEEDADTAPSTTSSTPASTPTSTISTSTSSPASSSVATTTTVPGSTQASAPTTEPRVEGVPVLSVTDGDTIR